MLLTTVNFPDIMLPYFHRSTWTAWFFVAYLVVGLYFLMNLILAVAYMHYRNATRDFFIRKLTRRRRALKQAFGILVDSEDDGSYLYANYSNYGKYTGGEGQQQRQEQQHRERFINRVKWSRLVRQIRPELDDDVVDLCSPVPRAL